MPLFATVLIAAILWIVVIIRDDFVGVDYSGLRKQLAKNFFFNKLILERQRTKTKALAMQLTFYEPSFEDLKKIITTGVWPDGTNLVKYRDYYQKAVSWFPQISELWEVLGVLYYHMGQAQKSADCLQRAIQMQPQFFWSHYNLGVILYADKQYSLAKDEFRKALACPFDLNLRFIVNSSSYLQIFWPQQNWGGFSVKESLENGYRNAQMLLKTTSTPGVEAATSLRIF